MSFEDFILKVKRRKMFENKIDFYFAIIFLKNGKHKTDYSVKIFFHG